MNGDVLVLGGDERLRHALESLIPEARVKAASSPADTEGLGIDVIVIAGAHSMADLNEIRVHPALHSTPVVLVAPGHNLDIRDWRAIGVWPVTEGGFGLLDEVIDHVTRLLARASHPSCRPSSVFASLRTAS